MDGLRAPTVNDLRLKLCYICREEERHDNPPNPPPVWTHPCKCTLVAHESCLIHWIKTQERDFGRSRGQLKCPQCGDLYEFEGFNPLSLRILNFVNRALSRSGRVFLTCCTGTIIVSLGAGVYMTCAAYGAFAVREFLGPDIFQSLLTSNPTHWPWQAWVNLPLVPFSLIASRTSLVLWTTSPLVPLLFPWPATAAVSAAAATTTRRLRLGPHTPLPLWPPPPALVCALFPLVRKLYNRLRLRITDLVVKDEFSSRSLARRREPLMLRVRLRGQQLQRQREQQERLQRLQEQEQQAQQQRQQPVPPVDEHRLRFQVGGLFGVEFTHFVVGHGAAAADAPGLGAAAGAVDGAADQQQPQQPAAQEQRLPADQGPQQQQQPPPDVQQQEGQLEQPQPQGGQQRQVEQEQEVPPPQPQPQPQGGQQRQVEQEQEAPPAQPQLDENEPGAVAAQAIRAAGAGLGRLIGGALAMPTIARVMGALLLRISHVLPFVRTIIAPRPPPGPASAFVGLLGPRLPLWRLFGAANPSNDWPGGFGAKVLGGFFATSQEWAMSDPVWWRNALGLGIFIMLKDGLKILHLRLAKKEVEDRRIKSKSFSGVDLTGLDLIERDT